MNEELGQESPQQKAPPKRSGSEKRRRGAPVSIRFTTDERALVDLKARDAGLSVGSYGRATMLGDAGPRAKRAPPINAEVMGIGIAALNKAGNNLNQIAHSLNAGKAAGLKDVTGTLAAVRAAVTTIMEAMGRKDRS